MAELKTVWMVRDLGKNYDLFSPDFWPGRPEVPQDEEVLLAQVGYVAEGYSIDEFTRIVMGTGKEWWTENTKVYDDAASAKKDALNRLNKLHKRHERLTKMSSAAVKVAARFSSNNAV